MYFAMRKARTEDGRVNEDLGTQAPGACERWRQRQKERLASSVADFVKYLFVWEVQIALQRTLDHVGGRESESENAWQISGQISEQRFRRTSNSDTWGNQ